MITTILTQYEGTISYCGDEIKKMGSTYRNILGYMPQITTGYGDFTAKQFLYYMAALKGIKKEEAEQKIKALSSILNLDTYLNRKIKAYSGGMKQRLFFPAGVIKLIQRYWSSMNRRQAWIHWREYGCGIIFLRLQKIR